MSHLVALMQRDPGQYNLGQGQSAHVRLSRAIDIFASYERGGRTDSRHKKWKTIRLLGERLEAMVRVYGRGLLAVFPFYEIHGVMGGGDSERRFDSPMISSFMEAIRLSQTHYEFFLGFSEDVGLGLPRLIQEPEMPAARRVEIKQRMAPRLQAFVPPVLGTTDPYQFPGVTEADWEEVKKNSWLANRMTLPMGYNIPCGDLSCRVNGSNPIDTLKPGEYLGSDSIMMLMNRFVEEPWNYMTGPRIMSVGIEAFRTLPGDRFFILVIGIANDQSCQ